MKKREEIEERYKWDLSDYCKNDASCVEEIKKFEKEIEKIKSFEGKLTKNNDKTILECLNFNAYISENLTRLAIYVYSRKQEDLSATEAQQICALFDNLSLQFSNLSTFIDVEMNELETEYLEKLIASPDFKIFKNYLKDIIRNKPHMLSKKEEILLSKMSEFAGASEEAFDYLCDTEIVFDDAEDSTGEKHKLSHGTYSLLTASTDRTLRKNTIKNYHAGFGKFNNTISSLYIANIKEYHFSTQVRGFKNHLEMALFGEEISEKVYNSLIEVVNSNLHILQEYFEIKRKTLNLDKFYNYDIYAQVKEIDSFNLDFDEAVEYIKKALSPLGEDYVKFLDIAKKQRWFDVYESQNKGSGAHETAGYKIHPLIFLNHSKTFYDTSTIAHEFGHAMHSYFSNQTQPYTDAFYSIFCAEIASTVNESLLMLYAIKNAKNKDEKIYLLNQFFINVYATLYRQTYFAEFEQKSHEIYEQTKILTKDTFNNLYFDLLKKYFGENVEIVDEMKFEWSRVSHFYRNFYVYKYATGIISALIIANNLTSENFETRKNALEGYMKFLSAGSSVSPLDALKLAGVDLENPAVMQSAFDFINSLLNEWKNLEN